MTYFETILTVSLFCLGLRAITDDGMIGYFLREFAQKKIPNLGKPIILCSTCMSSFWGTFIFWGNCYLSNCQLTNSLVFEWLGVVFSAAFINSFFWAYYESINMCKN
jgi:hypothetical protein